MILQFLGCRVDIGRRQIVREGKELHISPKAFTLLCLLLERRPDVVPKETLLASVWPDVFVAEVNLSVLVAELRSALGDAAREPKMIRTHHGIGYSFVAPVVEAERRPVPLGPHYMLVVEGQRIVLVQGASIVGREQMCEVCIAQSSVSRRHAKLTVEGRSVTIEDLGSKNGTFIDSRRLAGAEELEGDATVRFGHVEGKLALVGESGSTTLSIVSPRAARSEGTAAAGRSTPSTPRRT